MGISSIQILSQGWDNSASRFKVHLGLKEYAKLREESEATW